MLVKTGFMPNPSTPYIQPPKVHKAGPGLGSISVQELLKTLSIEDIVLRSSIWAADQSHVDTYIKWSS